MWAELLFEHHLDPSRRSSQVGTRDRALSGNVPLDSFRDNVVRNIRAQGKRSYSTLKAQAGPHAGSHSPFPPWCFPETLACPKAFRREPRQMKRCRNDDRPFRLSTAQETCNPLCPSLCRDLFGPRRASTFLIGQSLNERSVWPGRSRES